MTNPGLISRPRPMNEQEGANFGMAHCSSHVKSLVLLLYLRGLHGLGFKIWKSLVKSSTSKKEQQNKQWSFIIPTVWMRLGTGYRHDAQLTSAEFEVTSQCVETGMVSMNRGTVESFTSWQTKIKIPNPLTSSETITVGPRGNIGLQH